MSSSKDPSSGTQNAKGKLLRSFTCGLVQASCFENTTKKGDRESVLRSVTLQRRYQDRSGQWQSSHSFSGSEIPAAQRCLHRALVYLEQMAESEVE